VSLGDPARLGRHAANVALVGGANLFQHKARLIAAVSGIAVALFLLLLQYESLAAVRERVAALYSFFNFDIALVPDSYQIVVSPGTLSRVRLSQAKTLPEVRRTFGVNITIAAWLRQHKDGGQSALVIGIDNDRDFIRDPEIRAGMDLLSNGASVLFDRLSQADIDPSHVGGIGSLGGTELEIKGLFNLGLFFYAAGGIIVPTDLFTRLTGRDPHLVTLGLLQIAPGADVEKVKRELNAALPHDVQILTREELIAQEQAYFVETKPIGIMMDIGMLIACLVAVTIMIQVLATEIGNRMNEYAVLKAMGFSPSFVYGIGVTQSAILAVAGLLPALAAAGAVFAFIHARTHLHAGIDLSLLVLALGVALGTGLLAAAVVLWRIQRADPAELY